MRQVTGPFRLQAPAYDGVADLLDPADLLQVADALESGAQLPASREPGAAVAAPPHGGSEPDGSGVREPLGHRVTRRFFTLCEHPRTRERTMSLLRRSADSAVGGRLLVAFLSRMAFRPVLRSRRIDHAASRIELACAQLGGVAVLRYVTRMEPVASMGVEDLVDMIGPAVDATLTAPLGASEQR